MFLLVIVVFIISAYLEISHLIKQKQFKELILYSSIFLPALILSLLLSINIKVPSPAPPLEKFLKMVIKFFSS